LLLRRLGVALARAIGIDLGVVNVVGDPANGLSTVIVARMPLMELQADAVRCR
jgi:hypothetical protein